MKNCDMCGSAIENGKCSCGTWIEKEDQSQEQLHMMKALEAFHDMKQMTFTGDMPHLGVSCVYFRGDYSDCKRVEQFIKTMKGRPYYEE